jgi:nucleoside-diphosphate-sugar epimerase
MRVLIVGGTGLISNSLTAQLAAAGHSVTHYNRGHTKGLGPKVEMIVGDRRDFDAFARQIGEAGTWDAVFDMICYRPDEAQSDLDVFRGRAGQLIMCSTTDVYAKPAARYPIAEDEPHAPLNEYGRNKSLCEGILLRASNAELPVTVIRPAHTYGPGSAHRGHIVHSFGGRSTVADRIRKGLPIIVHGDGSSFWTSCHADDVARAFAGALGNERARHRVYHATGEEWMTWERYFRLVAEAMGAPEPRLVHIPTDVLMRAVPERAEILRDNFRFNNIFDNSAAHEDLGFRYTIPFLEGMRRTVEWVDANGGFEDCANEPWYDELLARWAKAAETMSGLEP